jgi:hypothetical protein
MWYREAQTYNALNQSSNAKQWSNVTWNPKSGLQFWNADGKLIVAQQPNTTIFETLRSVEPMRFKSDYTDRILLDVYERSKAIAQAIVAARQTNPSMTTQQVSQITNQYMSVYSQNNQLDSEGNLQNAPEYYPQTTPQSEAQNRQNIEKDYLAAPKRPGDKNFEFTQAQPQETGDQYRARYTTAYDKAYAEYEANGRKIPFTQWKKQFDENFSRGVSNANSPNPSTMNQVQTQNQPVGTYRMIQDSVGNISIAQADGRIYAYIPASEVQYQIEYIKKMTGKTPVVKQAPKV